MNQNKKGNIFEVLAEYDNEKRKEIATQKAKEKKKLKKQRQRQRRIQQQKESQKQTIQIKPEQIDEIITQPNQEPKIEESEEKNDELITQNIESDIEQLKISDQKDEEEQSKIDESMNLLTRIKYLEETNQHLMNYVNQLLQAKSQTDFTIFNLSNDVIQLRNENALLRSQIYDIAKYLLTKEQEANHPTEKPHDSVQQKPVIGKGQQEFFKTYLRDIVDKNVRMNQSSSVKNNFETNFAKHQTTK